MGNHGGFSFAASFTCLDLFGAELTMNDAAFIFCLFLFVAYSMEASHWIFDASITMFLGKLFKKL